MTNMERQAAIYGARAMAKSLEDKPTSKREKRIVFAANARLNPEAFDTEESSPAAITHKASVFGATAMAKASAHEPTTLAEDQVIVGTLFRDAGAHAREPLAV